MTTKTDELKTCPFCDGKASFERQGTHLQSCIVVCGSCGCRHESGYEYELSAYGWNTRAALQEHPEIPLQIIRKWPDGFEDRLQAVWLDVTSFIPNVKLYDLQRVLAEFGFTMTVTGARRRIEGEGNG